jgi:hypothetical protein
LRKNQHVHDLPLTRSQIRRFGAHTPKLIPEVRHYAVSQIIKPNKPLMSRPDFTVSIGHAGHFVWSVGLPVAAERMLLRCLIFCLGCSNWRGGAEAITVILEMLFRMFERGLVSETPSPFSWKPMLELA